DLLGTEPADGLRLVVARRGLTRDDPGLEDRDDPADLVAVSIRVPVLRPAEHTRDPDGLDDDARLLRALAPHRLGGPLARIDGAARELPAALDVLHEEDAPVGDADERRDRRHEHE